MKNITHTSPREWYNENEKTINDLGFYMCSGDGDNIGLTHDSLNNEIHFYWNEENTYGLGGNLINEDNFKNWIISTLYDGENDLFEEVETEEDVFDVLEYVLENIEMFNCDEEYEEE